MFVRRCVVVVCHETVVVSVRTVVHVSVDVVSLWRLVVSSTDV